MRPFASLFLLSVIWPALATNEKKDAKPHSSWFQGVSQRSSYEYSLDKDSYCAGTICYSQEECCSGTVCITHSTDNSGLCAKLLDQPEGKLCMVDDEQKSCVSGLKCSMLDSKFPHLGVCVNPNRIPRNKEYFDPCITTIDCDTSKHLCCKTQSSFRRNSRQICSYYEDPTEECIF